MNAVSSDTIFEAGKQKYSLDWLYNIDNRKNVAKSIQSLTLEQQRELINAVLLKTEECLEGAENFGIKYVKTVVADRAKN